MKLLSYYDERANLDNKGHYFFWGFTVEGNPDEVVKRLTPLIENSEQLKKVESNDIHCIRSELKSGDRWLYIKPQPGSAVGIKQLKRVLLLESIDAQDNQTRISCSLQGAVDGQSLSEVRPDIPPTECPQVIPEITSSDTLLPENLSKSLDYPLLQPKFKQLNYSYTSKKNNSDKPSQVSVEIKSENGMLSKIELYTKNFSVERLTKADLVQLKSKMNGIGDSRVMQSQELEVKAPKTWSPGQTLSVRILARSVPVMPNEKPIEALTVCQVGQRTPARRIYASLPGDASNLECNQDTYRTTYAFIEDLGVALMLKSTELSNQYAYEITALEIVR